ncbi:hypothetical protein HQN87_25010 [Paenibacillus tritici]|uniref:VOC domain-containing protein n=1 Tax=Paenibacillus tritici TaxID=1873425 RepID=A0ABX2DV71_9BACL|nr:hypothetical protein [Paenibacillus tritici]NQX48596.1 hypothetical protein [Paenibacillus tritici]
MIREVEMLAQSIAELKEFYVDSLGLTLITENSTSFSVKVGESSLSFTESGQSAQPFYHFAFNIPENQIGEAVRWITPKAAIIPDQDKQVVYFEAWNWFMSDQEAYPHTLTVQTDVCEVTLDPWNEMKVSAKR